MARFRDLSLTDFNGGLNVRGTLRNLQANESPRMDNVDIVPDGGFIKSNGYVVLNTIATGFPINGIVQFNAPVGQPQTIYASNKDIFKLNTDGTTTKLTTGDVANVKMSFESFNDFLIATNGVDIIKTYNGTVIGELDGFPGDLPTNGNPKHAVVWNNKLVLWGDATNPTSVYFSASGDHNDYTTANGAFSVNVSTGDGLDVVSLSHYYERLIIHKSRNGVGIMKAFTGQTTPGSGAGNEISVIDVFDGVASDSHTSVSNALNDQLFVDGKFIRSLSSTLRFGDVETRTLSYKIKPITNRISEEAIGESFSLYYPNRDEVWFFVPTGSSVRNDTVLIYNLEVQAWTTRSGFTASSGAIIDGVPVLGTYDGEIRKMDFGGSYGDKAIIAEAHTFFNSFGNPALTKKIRHADITIDRVGKFNITVESVWDYQGPHMQHQVDTSPQPSASLWGTALWGVGLWSTATLRQVRQLSSYGFGKMHQFQFSNTYKDQPFQVMSIDYAVTGLNYRPIGYDRDFSQFVFTTCFDNLLLVTGDFLLLNTGGKIKFVGETPTITPPGSGFTSGFSTGFR